MARGKYAEKAAKRQAELEAAGNLDLYKKRVAQLTEENKALRERLVEKDRAHSKEVRRLKAERNEGVSPMLGVVESENARLRDEVDRLTRKARDLQDRWNHATGRVIDHFDEIHRDECPRDRDGGRSAAVSAAMRLTSRPGDGLEHVELIDDDIANAKLSNEGKVALARARGIRGVS